MTDGRHLLREIFSTAVREIDPADLVRIKVGAGAATLSIAGEELRLASSARIAAIAAGKAAAGMAAGLHDSIGDRLTAGLLLVNDPEVRMPEPWLSHHCSHPLPGEENAVAAAAALELAQSLGAGDLLICLISGGASSMMSLPAEGISIGEKAETAKLLMLAGADIAALNALRKHLSRIKGGGLARAAAPSRCITFAISDVPGDRPDVIASGPTVPDQSAYSDALRALEKYGLIERVPTPVLRHLEAGLAGDRAETLKQREIPGLENDFHLLCNNRDLLSRMEHLLRRRGCHVLVEPNHFQGEAREFGARLARRTRDLAARLPASQKPYALLCGGETTVTVRGTGRGGRNSEAALAAAIALENATGCSMIFAGSDGIDGPTDAAGAVIDGSTIGRARAQKFVPRALLDNNDAYRFFAPLGDLVITGPTGTNVMDVAVALIEDDDSDRKTL